MATSSVAARVRTKRYRQSPKGREKSRLTNQRWRARHADEPKKPKTEAQKEAHSQATERWRVKHPTKYKEWWLRRRYGLTLEDVDAMLADQNGVCRICATDINGKSYVDHCHQTMRVRGLLCLRCNSNLGWLEANHASIVGYLGQ
jgi:hypothetical protein